MYNKNMSATAIVAVPCRQCNEVTELNVGVRGFMAWQKGELIQNALPELSADQRELLISGTCDKCWKEMFGSDEE
jgi:hypothetical protein